MSLAHASGKDAITLGTMIDIPFEKRNLRIAFIGTGKRGTSLLENLLAADGQVVALCDVVPEHAQHAASFVVAAGQAKPQLYTDGPYAFEAMLAKNDIDLVFVATP
jgi:predicted dehydrogenase